MGSVNSLSNGGAAVVTPIRSPLQEIVVTSASYNRGRVATRRQVQVISKGGTNTIRERPRPLQRQGTERVQQILWRKQRRALLDHVRKGTFTIVAQHCRQKRSEIRSLRVVLASILPTSFSSFLLRRLAPFQYSVNRNSSSKHGVPAVCDERESEQQ